MTYFNEKKATDPKWIAGDDEHEEALAENNVSVEAACRIKGCPVRWLVENVIPQDTISVIDRLNELARSLHAAIVVLVRTQLSVEGRITSRQLGRVALRRVWFR
jgi:hypothetical protein